MTYTEAEIRREALVELAKSTNGTLTTSDLIHRLESRLAPTGKDAEIAEGRSDSYFSQKVRNLISHRNHGTGLVTMGCITYDSNTESLTITAEGRRAIV